MSLRTELINQVRGNDSGKAVEPLKKDKQVDAVVELIKANYLILSLVSRLVSQEKNEITNVLLTERKARSWQQISHCLRLDSRLQY